MATNCEVTEEKVKGLRRDFDKGQDVLNGNLKRLWKSHGELKEDIKDTDEKNEEAHEKILVKFDEQRKNSTSIVNAAFITILSSTVVGLIVLSLK